jgi:SAM-dependent methyltransferase
MRADLRQSIHMPLDVPKLRTRLNAWRRARDAKPTTASPAPAYDSRVASEYKQFSEHREADRLPEIYQYWSNEFLRPRLLRAGFDGPMDMFQVELARAYEHSPSSERRFLSIGSGDCQTEVALARHLVDSGSTDFVFECFEINPELVARGNALAATQGVADRIEIVRVDVNSWSPSREYDAVVANSSLHHIQNLEGVFDGIAQSLLPTGTFVTSDTIGRNGHMRWPEALSIVEEYWRELPERYRFNCQIRRQESDFVNWDCSSEGFEGIRAQDILPLLIERFDFDFFAAFANIVDPFIDRTFGHNFDPAQDWDRAFVQRIEARDRAEILRGNIKPTHVVAAMCVGRPGRNVSMDGLTPRFSVRDPRQAPRPSRPLADAREILDDAPRSDEGDPAACVEDDPETMAAEAGAVDIAFVRNVAQANDYLVAQLRPAAKARGSVEVAVEAQGIVTIADFGDGLELGLGRFWPGNVTICARLAGHGATTTVRRVDDRPARPDKILPLLDYSDLWWNPSEPGWGVGIHQHANGQLVAFWLGYNTDGAPVWLSLHPGGWTTRRRFDGTVYRHRGADERGAHGAREVLATPVGSGYLDFEDWKTCSMRWQVGGDSIAKSIERMDF